MTVDQLVQPNRSGHFFVGRRLDVHRHVLGGRNVEGWRPGIQYVPGFLLHLLHVNRAASGFVQPPFHHPVFVLTHHAREPLELKGGNTFTFVTDGIESALDRARRAAGGQDVSLGGGANAAQQYLGAGLVDELLINLVPILLGSGERLFDRLGDRLPTLEPVSAIPAPGVTHLKFRVR